MTIALVFPSGLDRPGGPEPGPAPTNAQRLLPTDGPRTESVFHPFPTSPALSDTPGVSPRDILVPRGSVNHGMPLNPTVEVRNTGPDTAEVVAVHFTIADLLDEVLYHDSTTLLNLVPGTMDTVTFATWFAVGRDSLTATAWVYWADDPVHEDDTVSAKFMVHYRAVSIVEILQPPRVCDSGVVYRPRCRVSNFGTRAETFELTFKIGPWHSACSVSLLPGYSRIVTAPDSWRAMPGNYIYRIEAKVEGNMGRGVWVDTIRVSGTVGREVAIEGVSPVGTVDTLTTVVPAVRVANYGGQSEPLALRMTIRAPGDSLVYADSNRFTLPGGGNTVIGLRPTRFRTLGEHVAYCSLFVQDDTILLSVARWTFMVVPALGLAGEQTLPAGYELRTDFAGRQISFAVPVPGSVALAVLASDGRTVRRLRDGPCAAGRYALTWDGSDDAGRQAGRGIYYVRMIAPGFTAVQKLIRV
ncbi:MAG TPA: hypothetical protein ENN51_08840, partial [candidate division WOR-3 bacterium]|nr:hypothetical protein [candidate division WOR-3 bacterium]